jgi:hypothetical protein
VQLHQYNHDPTTTYNGLENILTEAELQLFVILASVTCLKPLFQPFHPGLFAATDTNLLATAYTNRPGGKNGSRSREYYDLSGRNREQLRIHIKDNASDKVALVQSHQLHPSIGALRPDEGESRTYVEAGSSLGATGAGHRIETMSTWRVTYQDRVVSDF